MDKEVVSLKTPRVNTGSANQNLAGKVAIVTGGASGIGRASALALAEKGCQGSGRRSLCRNWFSSSG